MLQSRAFLLGTAFALSVVAPASAANETSVYNDVSASASSGTDADAYAEARVHTIVNGEDVTNIYESETAESASVHIHGEVVVGEPQDNYYPEPLPQEKNEVSSSEEVTPTLYTPMPEASFEEAVVTTEEIIVGADASIVAQTRQAEPTTNIFEGAAVLVEEIAQKIKVAIGYAVDYLFA